MRSLRGGSQLRSHKTFAHDASRCAGAATSFSAGSKFEAEWVAEQNPWRRLGGGACFPIPSGLFTVDYPDAGPAFSGVIDQRARPK